MIDNIWGNVMSKFVVLTGGAVTDVGKGVTAASLGLSLIHI